MQLGQTIKDIRKVNHLTQEEFAELFHVTRQTVSNWENEKSYPDLQTLVVISDQFDISLDKMLKEDMKMTEKLNTEVKWGKRAQKLAIVFGILIGIALCAAIIWFFVWSHNKSLFENKFQSGLSNYQYEIEGGYYIVPYSDSTYFALPRQTMPDYWDFDMDYHYKTVECYISSGDDVVVLTWFPYDGDKKDIYITKDGEDRSITESITEADEKEYKDVITYGCELYQAVYR